MLPASRDTVTLGARLHVVAVTTRADPGNRLVPGQTYRYQMHFAAHGSGGDAPETGPSLFTPGYLTEPGSTEAAAFPLLGYGGEGRRLPSFEAPPDDPGLCACCTSPTGCRRTAAPTTRCPTAPPCPAPASAPR